MAAERPIGRAAVFGGSGFLGREIVAHLAANGIPARVAVRHPDSADLPEGAGAAGALQAVYADVRDETSVTLAVLGCDVVVNAVGLYVESGAETYEAVHELGALNVAHQAAAQGVKRLVHISGIGADLYSQSSYVHSRGKGELLVLDVFPKATILRPSVIFGPSDKFLNTLAEIARRAPFVPLFGRGDTLLQPVYVGDVAGAVVSALMGPEAAGATYELGGPRCISYRALLELVMARAARRRPLLPVPFLLWDLLAAAASVLPRPPLTRAQVVLMKRDNVVAKDARSLADLGITPTALETVLPDYPF